MANIRRLPSPKDHAATFRAMARERHGDAFRALLAGDRDKHLAYLRDVDQLEEQELEAERRAARIRAQDRERAGQVRALDRLIALVRADVEEAHG